MKKILVTGSAGLIGSEAVRFYSQRGVTVHGIDNDMRAYFFGKESSTAWNAAQLRDECPTYTHHTLDIRDREALLKLFREHRYDAIIHAAAQPSHDWAAREPFTDFEINATGTLNLLEAARQTCPEAPFVFCSTNKVYGDLPNTFPLVEQDTRWELDPSSPYAEHGFDETLSIDHSTHSIFGASKVAADVMVQEYGRYFGMPTVSFRGGCLTGPMHSGAELHGFLAYVVKCVAEGIPYTIIGHKGKQVRDNIHAEDFVSAVDHFVRNPRSGIAYNMGGGRHSNCSVLEAFQKTEKILGKKAVTTHCETPRVGDHIWYISDVRRFQQDYPDWEYQHTIDSILEDICKRFQ
ncbi:NAD-dependent epimerase/dehydratase family protein [Candidatus Dojkabacteria bacterium]|nr:NAD-dependent epimerase/dehydratase family protein [Candidatus Dojkabacteria bacterium]